MNEIEKSYMSKIVEEDTKINKDLTENIAKLKEGQTIKEDTKLNEILDKVRLVVDLSNSKYYARQNSNRLNCIDINKSIISDIANT